MRRVLVVSEVALALTLLTGGGLLVKSFAKLQGVDPGFKSNSVLTFGLALPAARYPNDTAQAAFYDAVIPRIAQVPGVKTAGATSVMPFGGGWSTGSFNVEGFVEPPKTNGPWGDIRVVAGDFFRRAADPAPAGARVQPERRDDVAACRRGRRRVRPPFLQARRGTARKADLLRQHDYGQHEVHHDRRRRRPYKARGARRDAESADVSRRVAGCVQRERDAGRRPDVGRSEDVRERHSQRRSTKSTATCRCRR